MNDITAVAPRQNRFSWRALSPWLISAAVLLLVVLALQVLNALERESALQLPQHHFTSKKEERTQPYT